MSVAKKRKACDCNHDEWVDSRFSSQVSSCVRKAYLKGFAEAKQRVLEACEANRAGVLWNSSRFVDIIDGVKAMRPSGRKR